MGLRGFLEALLDSAARAYARETEELRRLGDRLQQLQKAGAR